MRRVAGRVDHWDELSINRAGRKHSADFARVISRCRELKSINSRYREIDDFPISENDFPGNNYRYSDIRWQTPAGGEQLEHRKLAHDKQPTIMIAAGCIAILHKYSKRGGITTSLIKDIAFYVQKHITPRTVVITSLLVRDKLLGAPASVKRVY